MLLPFGELSRLFADFLYLSLSLHILFTFFPFNSTELGFKHFLIAIIKKTNRVSLDGDQFFIDLPTLINVRKPVSILVCF